MIGDTIFAVASAKGPAIRGVLRISGDAAIEWTTAVLAAGSSGLPRQRCSLDVSVDVLGHAVPALALVMPAPRSFTGEDVVELHLPGSPALLAKIGDRLRALGARDATPGEFTRRAYEHGRLDLASAEAVADLIHAASRDELRWAADVLHGGLSAAVAGARAAVQDALAWIEAGLDFDDDETGAVETAAWLPPLRDASEILARLALAVPRDGGGGVHAVVLVGPSNVGKSSLCNALVGRDVALVDDRVATTRDVLAIPFDDDLTLFDAPGDITDDQHDADFDHASIALRDRLIGRASAVLRVVDALSAASLDLGIRTSHGLPVLAVVLSKSDLCGPGSLASARERHVAGEPPLHAVSALTGQGIPELRRFLRSSRGRTRPPQSGAARVAAALDTANAAVRRARDEAAAGAPPELVACALHEALEALDSIHGRSSPEDLLDRIFGRFCLGK